MIRRAGRIATATVIGLGVPAAACEAVLGLGNKGDVSPDAVPIEEGAISTAGESEGDEAMPSTVHDAGSAGQVEDGAVAVGDRAVADSPAQISDVGLGPNDAGAEATVSGLTKCGKPTFNPNGGSIRQGLTIYIVPPAGLPTNGGYIFYTLNGMYPTHTSPFYSGYIQVNQDETISAIAWAPGVCSDSDVATAVFVVFLGD